MICPVCKTSILCDGNKIEICPTCRVEAPFASCFFTSDSYHSWSTIINKMTSIAGKPINDIYNRAMRFYKSGNFEDARKILEAGINKYPTSSKLRFWHLLSRHKINYLGNPEEDRKGLCVFPLSEFPSLLSDVDYVTIVKYSIGANDAYIDAVKHIEKERLKKVSSKVKELKMKAKHGFIK